MKRLLIAFAAFSLLMSSIAAKEHFIYKQISQKEGLTSTVNCIYKEKDGDVWIGTHNGLYRFDGSSLSHISNLPVMGKRIFQIHADKKNNLWVLTNSGLARKSDKSTDFLPVTIPEEKQSHPFYSICEDEEGLWFGSYERLFRYKHSDGSIRLFCTTRDRPTFMFKSVHLLSDGQLLCCSHNGLILIDSESGNISDISGQHHKEVSACLVDSQGRIWIALYNNGIEVFQNGEMIRKYSTDNSALSNNIVLCLTESDSRIWAGTDGGGVNIIDVEKDNIQVLSHVSGNPSSLPAHSIKSLYTDQYDNVWAGSVRDGLISISRSKMITYKDVHFGLSSGLSNPTALFLYQEENSRYIWVGTDGEGINRFDTKTGKFSHYPSTLKMKIVCIATYSPDELALSVYGDRIWLFNKNSGSIRPLGAEDKDINYLIRYAGRSVNLLNEDNGNLLVVGNTIKRLDKRQGIFKEIAIDSSRTSKENYMYFGRTEKGIWMHDNRSFYLLENNSDTIRTKGHIKDAIIRSGHIGKDGLFWFATDNGVHCFCPEHQTYKHITTSLFTEASSVICDNSSRIWVGTDHGLYAFLRDSESFSMFGESDGAEPNEFLPKSRLLSNTGDIFLGGVQGLLHIAADYEIETEEEPSVRLNEVLVDNVITDAKEGMIYKVPRNSKTIEINVCTHEKDFFRHKMFSFRLSDGQNYQTPLPTLALRQMPAPGKYEIYASCIKRDGDWTEPVRLMTLHVPQPWFLSWWFITGLSFLVLLIFSAILIAANRRKANELKLVRKDQEQKVYQEKVAMLINISHELRTPLTLIMAPLKRLIGKISPDDDNSPTLNRIYRQSRRMMELLNMVLEVRKMEVGKNSLKLSRTEFNDWVLHTVEDIISEEAAEGIEIITKFDPRVGQADFDTRKCDTVMMNILINAIKHSQAGDRITIKTELTENGTVRTTISDQGPGLKDADMSRMFTRFYQSNVEQYGTGIGLSYSKILVELHGGQIGAENNPDKGASFWWEIPITSDAVSLEDVPQKAYLNELIGYDPEMKTPEGDTFSTANMRLMLVDDSEDLLEFLTEALSGDFAEIITAQSGNSALRNIDAGPLPDIIVSDVNMPDGNGYKLCQTLKQSDKYSHIPVILLTARGEEQSQSDSYKVGAEGFMAKPFEVETLLEMIRGILKQKARIRKRYLDNKEEDASYGSNEESFIIQFNRIVAENLSNPNLDQQLICREMGVSRALLYNKMRAITGTGAKEYITKLRIEKAKSLIENSGLPIAEISEMTGFSAQSYFSTAFKNYTGLTPSQYKQQCKQENGV